STNGPNIDFSGSDQIQTPQYPEIHSPSQDISDEVFQAKGDLMKSIQTFLEEFKYIPFGEKPKILLQAWDKFFAIQYAQSEDSNELFQKILEDLRIINKELIEFVPILSTKEPEYSPSMGYEHPNTTLETKSDKIIKSGVEELVPILSENEIILRPNSKLFAIIRKRGEVERLINVVKNDISDDSTNDPLLEEAYLFLASDNSIPPDLIYPKVFSFLLFAESEDTVFDPGISV
nr:hypothetical protein [Tanacetum cinerariifolium]